MRGAGAPRRPLLVVASHADNRFELQALVLEHAVLLRTTVPNA